METCMQQRETETVGQILLSCVDMCFYVALALTSDPQEARNITRDIVSQTWLLCDVADGKAAVNIRLLTALHQRLLQHDNYAAFGLADEAAFVENLGTRSKSESFAHECECFTPVRCL